MNWLNRIFKIIKPWLSAIIVVLILQFTGLLSSISFLAQSAILKTGFMDASMQQEEKDASFDYNFTIKDLNGNKLDFTQFKDKVIFINLWATWCGPCRAEMPTIQKLYEKIEDDPNIVFVLLSLDKDKDLPKVIKYLQDRNFTFSAYMPSGYLTNQLNVPSIPTTLVISKQGKIIAREVGTTNFNTNRFYKFLKDEAAKKYIDSQ